MCILMFKTTGRFSEEGRTSFGHSTTRQPNSSRPWCFEISNFGTFWFLSLAHWRRIPEVVRWNSWVQQIEQHPSWNVKVITADILRRRNRSLLFVCATGINTVRSSTPLLYSSTSEALDSRALPSFLPFFLPVDAFKYRSSFFSLRRHTRTHWALISSEIHYMD